MTGRGTRICSAVAMLAAASLALRPVSAAPVDNKTATQAAPVAGNPVAGEHLYAACMGCHSLDDNDVGPKHRGVVGRAAGTVAGYNYSSALKGSGIVWTSATLDLWLTSPQKLVPGTKMYFSVAKARDRADIIAYLAKQK